MIFTITPGPKVTDFFNYPAIEQPTEKVSVLEDGKEVGYALIIPHLYIINSLYINAEFRKCGYGKKLMKHILDNYKIKYFSSWADKKEEMDQERLTKFHRSFGFDFVPGDQHRMERK